MENAHLSDIQLAMTSAAVAGDAGGLYRIVARLLDEGTPFDEILFDLLVPTEKEVGRRWQLGDYLVSEEHAATATIETVVAILAGSFDLPSGGKRIVVATSEGDHHSLPARVSHAYLIFLGYRSTFLGASVLSSDLVEYLELEQPEAIVLSCAMTNLLPGARNVIAESHRAGIPVLVGGKAFGDEGVWASAVGADAWVGSPRDIPTVLERWQPDTVKAESLLASESTPATLIATHRNEIVATAEAVLRTESADAVDPRLSDEVRLLTGALEAALMVADETVLVDMIRWQDETLLAHGFTDPHRVTDAVLAGLGETSSARSMLVDAAGRARS